LTWVRVWLLIEIIFFFNWIFFSCIFVSYAYIFKLRSFSKSVEILAVDDDVWNDTGTEDFLKFLKFEYYFLTYLKAVLGTQIIIGFTNMYNVHLFGDRTFKPVGWIFILLILTKANHIIAQTYIIKKGTKVTEGAGKSSKIWVNLLSGVIHWICYFAILYIYF